MPPRFRLALAAAVVFAGVARAEDKADRTELPAWATGQIEEYRAINAFAEAALDKFFDPATGRPCCSFHHGNADDVVEGLSTWDRFALLAGGQKVRAGMPRVWQYIYDSLVESGDFKDGFYSKGYDAEHTGELYEMLFACMELDPADAKLAEANRKVADVIIDRCYNKETRLLHHPVLSTTGGHERKGNPYVDELLNGLYILNAFRAYMTTGQEKYRAWALEYGGKWNELAAANGGLLPFVADSRTGKALAAWWGDSPFSYAKYGIIVAGRYLHGWPVAMAIMDGGNAKHLSGLAGTVEAMFRNGKAGLPFARVDETGWSRDKAPWFVPKLLDRQYALTFDPAVRQRIADYYAAAAKAAAAGDKSAGSEEQFLRWPMWLYAGKFDETWATEQFAKGTSIYKTRLANLAKLTTMPDSGDAITEQVLCRPLELSMVDGSYYGDYDNQRAGAPSLAPVRYWRADGKCGLPDGVAALVRNVAPEGVEVWLCNTNDKPAELVITGGFYGQHRIDAVAAANPTETPPALVPEVKGLNSRTIRFAMPPRREVRLKLALTRWAYRPTLAPLTDKPAETK